MGLGQWALDVAGVLQASRGVLSRSAALRSHQWTPVPVPVPVPVTARASEADGVRRKVEDVERRVAGLRGEVERWRTERARTERGAGETEGEAKEGRHEDVQEEKEKGAGDDVPLGVDLNLFHTRRGSSLLGTLGRQRQSGAPPPGFLRPQQHGDVPAEPIKIVWRDVVSERVESAPEPASGANKDQLPPSQPRGQSEAPPAESDSHTTEHTTEYTTEQATSPASTTTPTEESVLPNNTSDISSQSSPSPTLYVLRESKVPSSRISRLWNYGGLAAGMLGGAISESFSRVTSSSSSSSSSSVLLSPANMERLVSRLSRMRGAALKLGQMMSIQDAKVLPDALHEVLQRVQDRADYMPSWQRDRVLAANLGAEWRGIFAEFDEKPMAAASIGQVHRATLKSSGRRVAVKIQFPGVADSINSDLDNLGILLTATSLLPKGMYLDRTIANARTELGWECDYAREADCARRYKALLADEPDVFSVPDVHPEACGPQVLTMDFMDGRGVTRMMAVLSQEQRDWIGSQILRLCLREITEFRFMQTDPNWSNFLYNPATGKLELLDFGASRAYPDAFARLYVQLLAAAARADREELVALSRSLGYLTGLESRAMVDAHVDSILTLAEPFSSRAPDTYAFAEQTVTDRVRALIPVMLRERLTPPPEETYSLHRKVSGAFLLCTRLGSRIRAREMFANALKKADQWA